jgi:hypothetical protein
MAGFFSQWQTNGTQEPDLVGMTEHKDRRPLFEMNCPAGRGASAIGRLKSDSSLNSGWDSQGSGLEQIDDDYR